jgi:energy-coupling factor transporter ATP-binding protein EcfA2
LDLLSLGGYHLRGLGRKNVLLGKNGCGKSRLLKQAEQGLRSRSDTGVVRYLSPERGGVLEYQAHIEQNLTSNVGWLADTRRQNRADNFRQQSAAQFRRLELLFLREMERTPELRAKADVTFDRIVNRINALLDRVRIERDDPTFKIFDRKSNQVVQPGDISSGESELISLGIECLVFERECLPEKKNFLLIDEPDVHLHPDLQARFAQFIEGLVATDRFTLLVATHSTALLGAMSEDEKTRLAFMRFGDTDIAFVPVGDAHRRVLPVFGAHPLSNVFNQAPVLLVEGEDDERVWQQAVRSAQGRVKIYPCGVDGITHLASFEQEVSKILEAVYDNAIGYSLRDRDLEPHEINDLSAVKRMRLNCRSAENLLVTDDVLRRIGVTWEVLRGRTEEWLSKNVAHPHHAAMSLFRNDGFDRRNADLKDIRNDLTGLMGSSKPWEVVVGQSIAALTSGPAPEGASSLKDFLGVKVCESILGLAENATGKESAQAA